VSVATPPTAAGAATEGIGLEEPREKAGLAPAPFLHRQTTRARAEVTRLDNEERKVLNAHYADTISDHIFNEEQRRIRRERHTAQELLERHQVDHEAILDTLDVALELTNDIQAAYLRADPTERRLLNHAFFESLQVDTEEIDHDTLAEPFNHLTTIATQPQGRPTSRQPAPKTHKPPKRRKGRGFVPDTYGGASRARTGDLLGAIQALSQTEL
jgi:hypothetical protein